MSASIMIPIAATQEPATLSAIDVQGRRSAPPSQSAIRKGMMKNRFARSALPAATPSAAPQSLAPGADATPSTAPAAAATAIAASIGIGILRAVNPPNTTAIESRVKPSERSEKIVGGINSPNPIASKKAGHILRKGRLRCCPRNSPVAMSAIACSANNQGSINPAWKPSDALMANWACA